MYNGQLHLTEALGWKLSRVRARDGVRDDEGNVTVSTTESGWGEVLGLCVIQHTVRLTKLLHQLSSRAHKVTAL